MTFFEKSIICSIVCKENEKGFKEIIFEQNLELLKKNSSQSYKIKTPLIIKGGNSVIS